MLIVLDYDETYTADPLLWGHFIGSAQCRGHIVICCTMRSPDKDQFNADVIEDMARHHVQIVYAANHRDKWAAVEAAGYMPENAIWIDDRPMYIWMNREPDELIDIA